VGLAEAHGKDNNATKEREQKRTPDAARRLVLRSISVARRIGGLYPKAARPALTPPVSPSKNFGKRLTA
jgi:hypothetical protein